MSLSGRKTSVRGVIGRTPRVGDISAHTSESGLEFDLHVQLRFAGVRYLVRPDPVVFWDIHNKRKSYRPDLYIFWQQKLQKDSWLVEVKYKEDFAQNREKYAEKFSAASRAAEAQNAKFVCLDEDLIRNQFWRNILFLSPVLQGPPPTPAKIESVKNLFAKASCMELGELLSKMDGYEIRIFWKMIVRDHLWIDMFRPITNKSCIEADGHGAIETAERLYLLLARDFVPPGRNGIDRKWDISKH